MKQTSSKILLELYQAMQKVRIAEEVIAEKYPEQEMRCPVHLCIGQEAVCAGVSANLSAKDHVFSGHRSHGHYIAKGGDLKTMMAELYGKKTGCSSGKGGSMHLVDLSVGFMGATPIVGSTIAIAVGDALAAQYLGQKRITVCYFGEGATEEGVFHESVNFAALKKLPILFVCENNLYSVYSPMSVRQPRREVYELAKAHAIFSAQCDGNDVRKVYEVSGEAISKIRSGKGPAFLEFKTYRTREHCGPNFDNDLGYRKKQEAALWEKKCPIKKIEKELLKKKLVNLQTIEQIKVQIKNDVMQAIDFAKSSPFPSALDLGSHVYAK